MRERIEAQTAIAFNLTKGKSLKLIDIYGKQVADFVCFSSVDDGEQLSTKATIDLNGTIRLSEGQQVFSNRYEPLLTLVQSSVQYHDLIHPACSPAMFQNLYKKKDHPNCLDNLKGILERDRIPDPINFFMNTHMEPDGKIKVNEPLTGPGDSVELHAEKNLIIGIAACSVEESPCNGFRCTDLEVIY